MKVEEIELEHSGLEIERIVYIWARYQGIRDTTDEGKHYTPQDIDELIRRLKRYKNDSTSFSEGFEVEDKEDDVKDVKIE